MAKIVKIPLVMKNGEKATDMKSLKENFDTESVIGYFLDGKLGKWLNDRYYEDEAEAVTQFSKDDPQLAKKLCEIFGAEYEENEVIHAEEIARRNERVSRLKQLTDDEEVLRNIDSVAFDQEELAELYDQGVEKIYLYEGDFKIPKSKQGLEYVLVGDVNVTGLPIKKNSVEVEEASTTDYISSNVGYRAIPEPIADKIAMKPYVNLKDYIVYYKNRGFSPLSLLFPEEDGLFFKVWNKITGEMSSFDIPEYDNIAEIKAIGNKMLIRHQLKDGILLYDVEYKQQEIICSTNFGDSFSVSGEKIAYTDANYCLIVYDIKSKKKQQIDELGHSPKFVLCGNKLFYYKQKNNDFRVFDADGNRSETLFGMDNYIIEQILSYEDRIYLFLYHISDNYVTLWSINLNDLTDEPIEHFKYYVESSYDLDSQIQIAPYFIYVKAEYGFPVYSFNMNTQKLTQVASECGHTYYEEGGLFKKSSTTYFANHRQVVGDYLYYYRGDDDEDQRLCRVNLANGTEIVIE